MMVPFWIPTNGPDLNQGDLLPNTFIPIIPHDFATATNNMGTPFSFGTLIVITQSCDLANLKTGLVALCPAFTLAEFEATNPAFAIKGVWEDVRKGRREGLYT